MSIINLSPKMFGEKEFSIIKHGSLTVELFAYSTGIEAVKISNTRGHLVILPYMGQMIWDATFDGNDLKMQSMFKEPHRATDILGTYGCFMYHAGILRNGNPTKEDDHNLHGEFPCAPMQKAFLKLGEFEGKKFIRIVSEYEYIKGFGDHYLASPSIRLAEDESLFDIDMNIQNLSSQPMDLMYMVHLNNKFEPNGIMHQMAEYNTDNVLLRTSIPSHVKPTQSWLDFMEKAAANPKETKQLNEAQNFDPEVVCFIKNLSTDEQGYTHLFMEGKNGDGQYCKYKPEQFPHLTRWILHNAEQKVAAFALPGTCDPEGYTTEKAKGNVISLKGNSYISYNLVAGYVSANDAIEIKRKIEG